MRLVKARLMNSGTLLATLIFPLHLVTLWNASSISYMGLPIEPAGTPSVRQRKGDESSYA